MQRSDLEDLATAPQSAFWVTSSAWGLFCLAILAAIEGAAPDMATMFLVISFLTILASTLVLARTLGVTWLSIGKFALQMLVGHFAVALFLNSLVATLLVVLVILAASLRLLHAGWKTLPSPLEPEGEAQTPSIEPTTATRSDASTVTSPTGEDR